MKKHAFLQAKMMLDRRKVSSMLDQFYTSRPLFVECNKQNISQQVTKTDRESYVDRS